jgi:putative DNA primase/helicase
MANGLGGDFSAYKPDPKALAEEINRKRELERLQKENQRLDEENQRLKKKLNGHAGDGKGSGTGNGHHQGAADEQAVIEILNGASVRPVSVTWQWNGWLAEGKVHLIAGAKGTMKTTIAIDLAAAITTGGRWPDGTQAPRGDVLVWSGEDDFADTLLPRLLAAGGDGKRFHYIRGISENGKRRPFDPARDMASLIEKARLLPDLRQMILDPVVSAISGNGNNNNEVRRGLQPFVDFVAEAKCAGIGITHYSKGTAGRDPVERITGSLAYGAVARVILGTAKPIAADRKRRLVRVASNIGPDGGGFEYAPIQELLAEYDFAAQRVIWGDRLEGTARELLADVEQEAQDDDEAPRRSAVSRFLSDLLADGPVAVAEIRREADAAGHSGATPRRACDELGVITGKDGFSAGWSWRLPDGVPPGGETEI